MKKKIRSDFPCLTDHGCLMCWDRLGMVQFCGTKR